MPETSVLSSWIQEVKTELKERKERYDELRIEFERLKTQVETRNKIFWALFAVFGGGIVALIVKLWLLVHEAHTIIERLELIA